MAFLWVEKWRDFEGDEQLRRRLAEAILKKVASHRKSHKKAKGKSWYKEIAASLACDLVEEKDRKG